MESKLKGTLIESPESPELPRLRGSLVSGLGRMGVFAVSAGPLTESTSPRLRGSLVEKTGRTEAPADSASKYNHPEIFNGLDISPTESSDYPDRVIYTIPDIGAISLLKIDGYNGKKVLQVDIAEIEDDKRGQGFGTDIYRYVASHLPTGYSGILSGTITNEAIPRIYESIGQDPNFALHRQGAMYLLEKAALDDGSKAE